MFIPKTLTMGHHDSPLCWVLMLAILFADVSNSQIVPDFVDNAFAEAESGWKSIYLANQNHYKGHDAKYDEPATCRWKHGIATHMTPTGYKIEQDGFMELATTRVILERPGSPFTSIEDMRKNPEFMRQWKEKFPYCRDDTCLAKCNDEKYTYYRTLDGSCNNPNYRMWGKSHTPHKRLLPPHYGDIYNLGYSIRKGLHGYHLPSARFVSNKLMRDNGNKDVYDQLFSMEFMHWGHFLKHDISQTPVSKGAYGHNIDCCKIYRVGYIDRYECLPIVVDKHHDPYFYGIDCMNFVRSSPAVYTDGTCKPTWREQLNQVSSYIDGSMIYGSDIHRQMDLRTQLHGLMKVSNYGLLPRNPYPKCYFPAENPYNTYCQYAGDERVDATAGSGLHHILMVKEHNRIAQRLHSCFKTTWDDEKIYQETRKIIIAIIQKITYGDYLPKLLGPALMAHYGLRVGHKKDNYYDPYINPTTANAFSAAAYRIGHTFVNEYVSYNFNDDRKKVEWNAADFDDVSLRYSYFNPEFVVTDNDGDRLTLTRGVIKDNAHAADNILSPEVLDHLFDDNYVSVDLGAYNIQRGRDHGLPTYNEWRKYCKLEPATNFYELWDIRHSLQSKFHDIYHYVEDIDLYAGGISEKLVYEGRVGPTFGCILGEQFSALKHGDSFWFERVLPGTSSSHLTYEQVEAIKHVSLAKIMCENFNLKYVQEDVFRLPLHEYMAVCSELPELDLSAWGCYGHH